MGMASWINFWICLFCFSKGIYGISERYYMEDECGRTIDMQNHALESIRLDLTKFEEYHSSFDCMIRITAPVTKFLQVQIDRNDIEYSPNCTNDFLQLFDGPELTGKPLQGSSRHICSSTHTMLSYTTTGQHLTLRFKSDGQNSGDGFRLLITAFRYDVECYSTEFRCDDTERCISEQLVCNRFQDCPDASDECGLSTTAVIGIAVASVVIVLSIVGLILCWCCCRKGRERTGSTKRLALDVSDSTMNRSIEIEKADIHYYRPKTVYQHHVTPESTYVTNTRPSSGSFVVTGPYTSSTFPRETQYTRHKIITVPPTALKDADGNYFTSYNHNHRH